MQRLYINNKKNMKYRCIKRGNPQSKRGHDLLTNDRGTDATDAMHRVSTRATATATGNLQTVECPRAAARTIYKPYFVPARLHGQSANGRMFPHGCTGNLPAVECSCTAARAICKPYSMYLNNNNHKNHSK
jgi:hypothetical protein